MITFFLNFPADLNVATFLDANIRPEKLSKSMCVCKMPKKTMETATKNQFNWNYSECLVGQDPYIP